MGTTDKDTVPSGPTGLGARLRGAFITGLAVLIPPVATLWMISAVVRAVDDKLLPAWLGEVSVPGLGLLLVAIATLGTGALTRFWVGRKVIGLGERVLERLPVISPLYTGIKQISDTVLAPSSPSFSRACLVQYPHKGMWSVAFVASDARGEIAQALDPRRKHISVFMPTTPNPTSGFLLFVPEADVIPLDM